ncbi:MAG: tetratricopeptide repeat protein [Chloroflexota bacterium]
MTDATPQTDEQFTERYRAIMEAWQSGDMNIRQAEKDLLALLEEARASGNPMNDGNVALNLGILHGYNGQLNDSANYFDMARERFAKAGADREVVVCELNIGEGYRLQGNFTRAQMFFRRAYEGGKGLDATALVVVALTNEGQMWLSMGSDRKATSCLNEALELAQNPYPDEDSDRQRLARLGVLTEIYHALTLISLRADDAEQAWEYAKKAYQHAQETEQPMHLGYGNRAIGDALTAIGTVPADDDFDGNPDLYYKVALDSFKKVKMEGDVAKTFVARGKSLIKRGKKTAAARLLQRALAIFTKLGMTDDAAKTAEVQMEATL